MQAHEVWESVVSDLELSLSKPVFGSYVKKLSLVEIAFDKQDAQVMKIGCPSVFLMSEVKRRFEVQIKQVAERVSGKKTELEFVVVKEAVKVSRESKTPLFEVVKNGPGLSENLRKIGLTSDLSLQTFAVSSSNEMAYAAAKAVSRSPGSAYNPLYLYGGVGVGKTHLMQGVGQEILKSEGDMEVIYCSGEEFTNEIISAIRKKSTGGFKKRYRSVGLLLIDDIQFIAGKTTVQEEFFHTFNAILKEGGQVIMTSDKPPKEIDALEERLRSRFEGGLTIDIGRPNFELRSAIVMIKARQMEIELPVEVAQMVAEREEDTRALIGSLMRLIAAAKAKEVKISKMLVEEVLKVDPEQEKYDKPKPIRPLKLIRTVAGYYGVEADDVRGARRIKSLVLPRHVAMYLLNKDYKMSLVEIGSWFGNRDHTSVMHAVGKVELMVDKQEVVGVDVERIRKEFYPST